MKNAIHMLASSSNRQMNSFVITTEGGKVIVIDGGYREDALDFLEKLRKITGSEKPHVDAWFLTHSHSDHVEAFLEIVEKYSDMVDYDVVYYNFPSAQFLGREDKDAERTAREFASDLHLFVKKACIVSGGDHYDVGDASFDILYTADFEFTHNVCNNSGIMMIMNLGGKKTMFAADCGIEAGEKVLRLYGNDVLKCDICQMAHHGQNGCDKPFYEAVRPEICLWCTPQWLWDNDAGQGYNTYIFKTIVVRGWMEELGVKQNYVTKDGDCVCLL